MIIFSATLGCVHLDGSVYSISLLVKGNDDKEKMLNPSSDALLANNNINLFLSHTHIHMFWTRPPVP
jgi:hypothetical protein